MPAIPIDPRTITWRGGSFSPSGKTITVNVGRRARKNPFDDLGEGMFSARFVVGFNVGDEPTWKLGDLVNFVKRDRLKKGADPSATFLAQRGIYRHRDGERVVVEDGAQVFILNLSGLSGARFISEMKKLGERITRAFKQESTILEIQKDGVRQKGWMVTP